jgi:hypothetical protein
MSLWTGLIKYINFGDGMGDSFMTDTITLEDAKVNVKNLTAQIRQSTILRTSVFSYIQYLLRYHMEGQGGRTGE